VKHYTQAMLADNDEANPVAGRQSDNHPTPQKATIKIPRASITAPSSGKIPSRETAVVSRFVCNPVNTDFSDEHF
jgi:hypothetical protein